MAALLQHSEKAALPSQTQAINEFHAAEAANSTNQQTAAPAPSLEPATATTQPTPSASNGKRPHVEEIVDAGDDDSEREDACTNPKRKFVIFPSDVI